MLEILFHSLQCQVLLKIGLRFWGLRDFIKINSNVMVINVAVCELYVYIMHDV